MSWSTDEYATNSNANAIRWGTMYNFWFTADAATADGSTTLDVFRTNSTATASGMQVPGGPVNPYDFNGDNCVDGADTGIFITQWGQPGGFADFNSDGIVNAADFGQLIAAWGCL